ncbi:MAG: glycosyltransferase family 2 protein [Methylovulum sp.]|nr:MAG: glycosyltransferase family 2 protein [Methylovulum sp.]
MKFGIGAIFKDELDYILEWLAWHRLAGFARFFIADNGSSDGTRQLLEALDEAGLITLFYVSPQPGAQQLAYRLIQQKYGHLADAIAFIDADEFIYADDGKKPVEHLERLFSRPTVGAVGVNWRIFGSSGKLKQEPGLVVERFVKCAEDDVAINRHIKSIVRPHFIDKIRNMHYFNIQDDFCYLNGAGGRPVFMDRRGRFRSKPSSFCELLKSPLRINHYVIKSLQEFTEKKRKRGDAQRDPNRDRGQQYFINHDLNDVEFLGMSLRADDIYKEIEHIKSEIRLKSTYYEKCNASFQCNAVNIKGWAVFETAKPKLMIFVNGELRAETGAFRYRADVVEAGITKEAYCGFQHVFTPVLKTGDVVDVSIYANPFKFKQNPTIIT